MRSITMGVVGMLLLGLLALEGCQDRPGAGGITGPAGATGGAPTLEKNGQQAVYTLSNEIADNSVIRFFRGSDGSLTDGGSFSTTGHGAGAPLASQGALIVVDQLLFAVNPGSNDISSLRKRNDGLELVTKVSSDGSFPVSLTVYGDLLYVVNRGTNSIAGFTGAESGVLTPIQGPPIPLPAGTGDPAQIQFAPDGTKLIVTTRASSLIVTFLLGGNGLPTGPGVVTPSSGPVPYGFDFTDNGILVVSEAAMSAVSSYNVPSDGHLTVISASVHDFQGAACWLKITGNSKFAYVSNFATNTISGYSITDDGHLALLDQNGVTAPTLGMPPADLAFSRNSQYLYMLSFAGRTISTFKVHQGDGSLTPLGFVGGLPPAAAGLAAQ